MSTAFAKQGMKKGISRKGMRVWALQHELSKVEFLLGNGRWMVCHKVEARETQGHCGHTKS